MNSLLARFSIAAALLAAAIGARSARADGPPGEPPNETTDARLARRLNALSDARDPSAVEAWAREMAAEGRLRPGTEFGASLLAGAAHEMSRVPGREAPALALWREARAASAPDSVARAEAEWSVGAAMLAAGDPAEAAAALEAFERAMRGGSGALRAFDSRERAFAAAAERLAATTSPRMRGQALVALGRFAEGADVFEALAERLRAASEEIAWDVFDDAARAAWRAGDRARSLRATERSIDAAPSGRARVLAEQRLLLAKHDLVDERGDPSPRGWPGDAFAREAHAALARVQGLDDAWSLALQVATFATLAGEPAAALPFFEWAFTDRAFLAVARADTAERSQLLVGAQEALRAGDLDRALSWLRTAESLAGAAIPGTESLRLRIDDALRAAGRDAGGAPAADDPTRRPAPSDATHSARPRKGLGGSPPDESGPAPHLPAPPNPGPPFPWIGLLAGALAIGLATAWATRRRRTSASPPNPADRRGRRGAEGP